MPTNIFFDISNTNFTITQSAVTNTPTSTATATAMATGTPTPTPTNTATRTATATNTATATATNTSTPTPTNVATLTKTPTATKTPSVTKTPPPTSEKKATIKVYKYNDRNGNSHRNQGEAYLSEWRMRLYPPQGAQLDTEKTAGDTGLVKFNQLAAGDYVVCEDNRSGWSNTQPGFTNAAFGNRPCYAFHIDGRQTVKIYFGNWKTNADAASQNEDEVMIIVGKIVPTTPDNLDGIIMEITPDNQVDDDNPDAPTAGTTLYLPIINNQ